MEQGLKEKLSDTVFKAIKGPLRVLPRFVHAIGAGTLISTLVESNQRLGKRLGELNGKTFLFIAKDIEKNFYLIIDNGNVKVLPHSVKAPDVTMKGEIKVFIELLLGLVDPDTVFFSRKLEVSGDTASAILLKNILADI